MLTEEHHRAIISRAIYETRNFDAILHRLGKEYDFYPAEEKKGKGYKFTWLKRGKSKEWDVVAIPEGGMILKSEMLHRIGELSWITLGTVTITRETLTLECLSKERLERGKRRLEELLDDYIIHKADTYEDIEKAIESHKGYSPDEGNPFLLRLPNPLWKDR